MKIKFMKNITLDYEDRWALSIDRDKNFFRGDTFSGVNVVPLSRVSNFSDIYFDDGNVALDVPNDSFEVC
jgi:hypothetical protein